MQRWQTGNFRTMRNNAEAETLIEKAIIINNVYICPRLLVQGCRRWPLSCHLIVFAIVLAIVGCFPLIGWLVDMVGGIVCLILMLMGILNVVRGEAKELPLIGKFSIYK